MVAMGHGQRRTVLGIYALTGILGVVAVVTNQLANPVVSTAMLLAVGTAFLLLGVKLSKAPVIDIEMEDVEERHQYSERLSQIDLAAEEQVLATTRSRH
jgi:hypothetical protein